MLRHEQKPFCKLPLRLSYSMPGSHSTHPSWSITLRNRIYNTDKMRWKCVRYSERRVHIEIAIVITSIYGAVGKLKDGVKLGRRYGSTCDMKQRNSNPRSQMPVELQDRIRRCSNGYAVYEPSCILQFPLIHATIKLGSRDDYTNFDLATASTLMKSLNIYQKFGKARTLGSKKGDITRTLRALRN